jgi:RNA polymerase sigma-70 factor (ECF subfamily)
VNPDHAQEGTDTGDVVRELAAGTAGHRQLFGVAYRMLGSVHDAEDALQEGFRRWQELTAQQRSLIREPVAWLTRVISRICLDELGTARARRESYTGFWLPEPVLGSAAGAIGGAVGAFGASSAQHSQAADPADVVTLDESVSMALLVAMEQLSPAERVSLILHDVFGVPFAEIADIVGRTPEASRQLATSARRNIRRQPRFDVQGADRDRVVAAFAKACLDGDVEALAGVLDPNVVSRADGGRVVMVARKPVVGAIAVARYLLGVLTRRQELGGPVEATMEAVNGRTGLVVRQAGDIVGVVDLAVAGGRVAEVTLLVNPEKLGAQASDSLW